MGSLGILHLSDLHMSKVCISDVEQITKGLVSDVHKLLLETNAALECICFTGDLIQRGDLVNEQLDLAIDHFVTPLMEAFPDTRFYYIPGNHEVDRSCTDETYDEALTEKLVDRATVNAFMGDEHQSRLAIQRIAFFKDYWNLFSNPLWSDTLSAAYRFEYLDITVGIACLNSAWRSSGSLDRGRLLIGEHQIRRTHKAIADCDLKIALVHHPTYWLAEHDMKTSESAFEHDFDLVLSGHIHDASGRQIIRSTGTTLHLICDPMLDSHNPTGFSFISFNPYTTEFVTFFREYYPQRRTFDQSTRVAPNGQYRYIADHTSNTGVGFRLVNSITNGFVDKVNSMLIPASVDETAPKTLREIFVPPVLSRESAYRKERSRSDYDGNDIVDFEEIMNGEDNVLLIGNKETGKSTLCSYLALHYFDNFPKMKKVPFVIDLRTPLRGESPVERAMQQFVIENADSDFKVSKGDIKSMIDSGSCVLVFDNVLVKDERTIDHLRSFVSSHGGNRFVFTINEDVFNTMSLRDLPDFGCENSKVYLRTLTKNRIRYLVTKWYKNESVDVDQVLNNVTAFMQHLALPTTPLLVSLILVVQKHYGSPDVFFNQGTVMERYLEIILEKLSPEEAKRASYDFVNKEDYLSFLAWKMVESGKYGFTEDEYTSLTNDYFSETGLDLASSDFAHLFFRKGILVRHSGSIQFRFRSMAEYYIAKRAQNNKNAYGYISEEANYLQFSNELGFLSGMKRNQKHLLKLVGSRLEREIKARTSSHDVDIDALVNKYFDKDFDFDVDLETLKDGKLSDAEKDKATDYQRVDAGTSSQQIYKEPSQSNVEKLYRLIILCSRILRNSEVVDFETKKDALRLCMAGLCVLWWEIKVQIDEFLSLHMADLEDEGAAKKIISEWGDILKIVIPMVLQNTLAESVGSKKLQNTISDLLKEQTDPLSRFLLTFLYSDIKLSGSLSVLSDYVKRTDLKDLLALSLVKQIYYYHMGHFSGRAEKSLESLIADSTIKYRKLPKREKTKIITDLKAERVNVRPLDPRGA